MLLVVLVQQDKVTLVLRQLRAVMDIMEEAEELQRAMVGLEAEDPGVYLEEFVPWRGCVCKLSRGEV